jgi:ABC-type sugar transport system substrate-binding protein
MRPQAIGFLFLALALGCSRIETPPHGGDPERALVAATDLRDAAKVHALLVSGADPNKMIQLEGHSRSAWSVALQKFRPGNPEQIEIIRALLKAGANPDVVWGATEGSGTGPRAHAVGNMEPLLVAMLHPDPQVVQAILAAKRNAVGGETSLVMAIESGQTQIAHLLVEAGVDVNCHPGANTPLLAAIEARDEAMMVYLEDHGAREKP